VLAYLRQHGDDAALVVMNMSAAAVDAPLRDTALACAGWRAAVCTDARRAHSSDPHALALRPYEALVMRRGR
jgi:hypothetical protein